MDQFQGGQQQSLRTSTIHNQQQQTQTPRSIPTSANEIMSVTPQDILAEARKNLQVLIDSGYSKELLHQLVESSQSTLPGSPNQLSLSLPTNKNQQQEEQQMQPQHQAMMAPLHAPPPPPPSCAPPPPPAQPLLSNAPSTSPTANSNVVIKTEMLPPQEMPSQWQSHPGHILTTVTEDEAAEPSVFAAPTSSFSHRPRISVSSTSSGSSGHASIWSNNSAQSSMSWATNSTAASDCSRAQAPLPMLPQTAAPTSAGSLVVAPASSKLNIYWCTSCETSFKRKYDWKRHEDEFHERWRKYPCPEPCCNRSFWGSNSFNQHHKQCHGCKTCPHAEKVVKYLRKRKYWACGFCSALHPARERHVEHVARHFESGMTKSDWMHSRVVYGLLHQPLIHEAWDALVTSKQPEYTGRRPQFSWHPSKTGRAQGFLENESAGQLQDLLEFFSGDEGEAQWIVNVAYDLADIVLTAAMVPTQQYSQPDLGVQQQFSTSDPRLSFASMSSQSSQQLMPSSDHGESNPFSAFRNSIFVPSQGFHAAQQQHSSPGSSSQSPMNSNHSQQSPLEHRELPQIPHHKPLDCSDGMMDFEYSPAPVVFEDWESLTSTVVEDTSSQNAPPDWAMMHYFGGGMPKMTS